MRHHTFRLAIAMSMMLLPVSGAAAHIADIIVSPSKQLQQGRHYLHVGKAEQAIKVLRTSLRNRLPRKQKAAVHNGICTGHLMLEEWDNALKHCKIAVRLIPNQWHFQNNLANAYLEGGNIDQALAHYETSLKLVPSKRAQLVRDNMALALALQDSGEQDQKTDERSGTQSETRDD